MNQYEYSSDLNIMLINHKAGLAQLFSIIAKSNANVIDIHTTELPDHLHSINLTIVVLNRVHLSKVIRQIKKLSSVKSVKRVNQKNIIKRN